MVNTHILSQEFEYFEPKTIEEAILLLATHGEKAKVVSGGTDLLVQMKMERLHPKYLISIAKIPALHYIIEENGLLTPDQQRQFHQVIIDQFRGGGLGVHDVRGQR
jgi:carbon-monoxide dehydrogenase medium subunit